MPGTKTTVARVPGDWFATNGNGWPNYGSADLTVSDDGGVTSLIGMTDNLQMLVAAQFGFTEAHIPRNAKIVGITLRTEGHGEAAGAPERGIRAMLCLGGGVSDAGAARYAGARVGTRAAWTMNLTTDTVDVRTTDGTANNGDPLWGFPWTPEAIFDPSFGVVFSRDTATPQGASERLFVDTLTLEVLYSDPATGYAWHPVIRCVPDNGVEETIDLRTVLTDLHGPMKTDAKYSAIQERRETINRRIVPAPFGFRAEIILTLDILTMADAANWTKIVNRCMSPDWAVYLSMDGGVTER